MYGLLPQETLDAIEAWEQSKKALSFVDSYAATEVSPAIGSTGSSRTYVAAGFYNKASCRSARGSMVTMTALEHAIKWNPEPLQRFAALHDFTGENVSFLTHVTEWKQSWKFSKISNFSLPSEKIEARIQRRRQQFNRAIRIYAMFVNMQYAEFSINLPARTFTMLDETFERPANLLYGTVKRLVQADIAPFAFSNDPDRDMSVLPSELCRDDLVWYWGPIPVTFNEKVFDAAEREIRYLVLTNTWPRFLHDEFPNQSDATILQKVKNCIRNWR